MGGYLLADGQKLQADEYIEWLEKQADDLAKALYEALPACPIHGDHPAHSYWLKVSDEGYAAILRYRKRAA